MYGDRLTSPFPGPKDDFSPLDFAQRFTGTFSKDGGRIDGTWEIAHDKRTWEKDFDLNYHRIR